MDMEKTKSFEAAYLKHQVEDNYDRFMIIPYILIVICLLFLWRNLYSRVTDSYHTHADAYLVLWLALIVASIAFRVALPKVKAMGNVTRLDHLIFSFAITMCISAATLTSLDLAITSNYTAYAFTLLGAATAYRTSIAKYLVMVIVTFVYFNLFYFFVLDNNYSFSLIIPVLAFSTIATFIAVSLENNREQLVHLSSQLEYINLKLQEESIKDPLTTLYNRRYLNDFLQREIDDYKRTAAPLCLAICDLDYFKKINDNLGHLTGDDCLIAFANILKANSRASDVQIRFGGEEFVIVMPRTNLDAAIQVVERIRRATESHQFDSIPWPITVSFGVTNITSQDDFDSLLDRADSFLYNAKRSGRNCVVSQL
ncbi:GGDEF domain-containing protein [uncultured Psychrosphaera sp.]|uniref:GGDEF domain-containing protein n=1 Tax=uncultured Psychrosphaera sp. TaxID=1403522 RepID=UPI0030F8F189